MNTIHIKKKATSLRLDEELYNYIEKLAKKENRSVNNFIETLLSKATNFHHPNEDTQAAMQELKEEKKSLKRYSSASDLMADL